MVLQIVATALAHQNQLQINLHNVTLAVLAAADAAVDVVIMVVAIIIITLVLNLVMLVKIAM